MIKHSDMCGCAECAPVVGSFEIADMEHEATEARLPAERHVSRQVGCSDLGALFVLYCPPDADLPDDIREWLPLARARAAHGSKKNPPRVAATWAAMKARLVRTPVGPLPEIIATKAAVRAKEAQTDYAATGTALERTLLATWRASLPVDAKIDPASIVTQHDIADRYPAEWNVRAPNVRCPGLSELVTYPDAWGRTPFGDAVVINAKCSREHKEQPDPPAWLQLQGEGMCCDALALLVLGQKWLADYMREPVEERPIRVWPIEPHPGARAAITHVVARAMEAIGAADAKFREMSERKAA